MSRDEYDNYGYDDEPEPVKPAWHGMSKGQMRVKIEADAEEIDELNRRPVRYDLARELEWEGTYDGTAHWEDATRQYTIRVGGNSVTLESRTSATTTSSMQERTVGKIDFWCANHFFAVAFGKALRSLIINNQKERG